MQDGIALSKLLTVIAPEASMYFFHLCFSCWCLGLQRFVLHEIDVITVIYRVGEGSFESLGYQSSTAEYKFVDLNSGG